MIDNGYWTARREYIYFLRVERRLMYKEIASRFGFSTARARALAFSAARRRISYLRRRGLDVPYGCVATLLHRGN